MGKTQNRIAAHLRSENIGYWEDKKENTFFFNLVAPNCRWKAFARALELEEASAVYICSSFPVDCPIQSRTRMAEFICLANLGPFHGRFGMVPKTGELAYTTFLVLGKKQTLNASLLGPLLESHIAQMEQFFSGVMRIIYSETTGPKEAYQSCCGKEDTPTATHTQPGVKTAATINRRDYGRRMESMRKKLSGQFRAKGIVPLGQQSNGTTCAREGSNER